MEQKLSLLRIVVSFCTIVVESSGIIINVQPERANTMKTSALVNLTGQKGGCGNVSNRHVRKSTNYSYITVCYVCSASMTELITGFDLLSGEQEVLEDGGLLESQGAYNSDVWRYHHD